MTKKIIVVAVGVAVFIIKFLKGGGPAPTPAPKDN